MKWIFSFACFLIGGAGGWFLRGKHEARKVLQSEPSWNGQTACAEPVQWTQMTTDNVPEELLAETESPCDDLPDEIVIPDLPFMHEETEEDEEDDDDYHGPAPDAPRIEEITEDQYLSKYYAYGKDTLLYFPLVDELTFSDEDRIDDKTGTAGNVYQMFNELDAQHQGVVYVRNNRLSCDFMIELRGGAPYWYEGET